MKSTSSLFRRNRTRAAFSLAALFIATPAWSQSTRVVRVEEHWELHLKQPDQDRSAPQVTMVMSPNGNLDGEYFLFTLNHATVPDYRPGGLQVQLWTGPTLVENGTTNSGTLSHDEETVTWVQSLSLEDGTLHFRIENGASESWEAFGGDDLSLSALTSLVGLNGYRPAISLTESEVGYADNRVESLVLKKLVWVTEDGTVHEQNAPIAIDTSLDQ